MRTNIDIDAILLREAMDVTGQTTKKGVVEEALRRIVLTARRRQAIESLWGMGWNGDLDKMREDWSFDPKPSASGQ